VLVGVAFAAARGADVVARGDRAGGGERAARARRRRRLLRRRRGLAAARRERERYDQLTPHSCSLSSHSLRALASSRALRDGFATLQRTKYSPLVSATSGALAR